MDSIVDLSDIHRKYRKLVKLCGLRKNFLKNGTVFTEDHCSLNRIFNRHVLELVNTFESIVDKGVAKYMNLLVPILTQLSLCLNLFVKCVNDSLSPLSRRSEEASLVIACILHNDIYETKRCFDSVVLAKLRRWSHDSSYSSVVRKYKLSFALSSLDAQLQRCFLEVFPTVISYAENLIHSKLSANLRRIFGNSIKNEYFVPLKTTEVDLELSENFKDGCLKPLLTVLLTFCEVTSAQKIANLAFNATLDTIMGEILAYSLRMNEIGVYLLFLQFNNLCRWLTVSKIELGFKETDSFLLDGESCVRCNYCLRVLQSAMSRTRSDISCRLLPHTKYRNPSAISPDSDNDDKNEIKRALEALLMKRWSLGDFLMGGCGGGNSKKKIASTMFQLSLNDL